MRVLAWIPFVLIAGCGEAPENKAEPAAAALAPGQWALTSEVTSFRQADQGRPAIDTPVGTRATAGSCAAPGHQLPTEFLAGEGYRCNYGTYYVRNGRVNVTMSCTREGLDGSITMAAEGTFQANGVEFRRTLTTSLPGDGDVAIETRVTGRRTGDCTPEADEGAGRNKQG
jgi:Protein of unknown function (DUF3617)